VDFYRKVVIWGAQFMGVLNFLFALIISFILYHLVLVYIGSARTLQETWLPVLLIASITFISKYVFHFTSLEQTTFLVFLYSIVIWGFHRIDYLISLIGALLGLITLTIGDLVLVTPITLFWNVAVPRVSSSTGFPWVVLNLSELLAPLIAYLIMRLNRFSLMNYITIPVKSGGMH
jgi:hypothetical protein